MASHQHQVHAEEHDGFRRMSGEDEMMFSHGGPFQEVSSFGLRRNEIFDVPRNESRWWRQIWFELPRHGCLRTPSPLRQVTLLAFIMLRSLLFRCSSRLFRFAASCWVNHGIRYQRCAIYVTSDTSSCLLYFLHYSIVPEEFDYHLLLPTITEYNLLSHNHFFHYIGFKSNNYHT